MFKRENLYHPFSNTNFGIHSKAAFPEDSVIGYVIDEINLYYQPVQNPLILIIFIALKIVILIVGGYLHLKVYRLMKHENGLLKDITQLLVCSQMIFWPFLVSFTTITDFIHPMSEVVGKWFCSIGSFVFYFLGNIITSHSFLAALMRYFFIVHREMITKFGKEKAKRLFLSLALILPLIMAIWKIVDGTELDSMSFINKCNGKHHNVFLLETSTSNVARRNFCGFENYDSSKDVWNQGLSIIHRISCVANQVIMIIMGLNVSEGLIYCRIWNHIYK